MDRTMQASALFRQLAAIERVLSGHEKAPLPVSDPGWSLVYLWAREVHRSWKREQASADRMFEAMDSMERMMLLEGGSPALLELARSRWERCPECGDRQKSRN